MDGSNESEQLFPLLILGFVDVKRHQGRNRLPSPLNDVSVSAETNGINDFTYTRFEALRGYGLLHDQSSHNWKSIPVYPVRLDRTDYLYRF
jgi:hypothetical protein